MTCNEWNPESIVVYYSMHFSHVYDSDAAKEEYIERKLSSLSAQMCNKQATHTHTHTTLTTEFILEEDTVRVVYFLKLKFSNFIYFLCDLFHCALCTYTLLRV